MADEHKIMPAYLPWFLAWDCAFLPFEDTLHEYEDLGGDLHMVSLARRDAASNILFKYDHEWDT